MSVKQAFLKSNTKCVNEVEEVDFLKSMKFKRFLSIMRFNQGMKPLLFARFGSYRKYTEEDRVKIRREVVYTGLLLQCVNLLPPT